MLRREWRAAGLDGGLGRRSLGRLRAACSGRMVGAVSCRPPAPIAQPVHQREAEHGHAHHPVHGEERGVEPGEVAGPDQLVLVGQDRRRPRAGRGSTRAPNPAPQPNSAKRGNGDRRAAAWPAGSRAARPAAPPRSGVPRPGRSPRRAARRGCRTRRPRWPPPARWRAASRRLAPPARRPRDSRPTGAMARPTPEPEVGPPGEPLGEAVEQHPGERERAEQRGRAD